MTVRSRLGIKTVANLISLVVVPHQTEIEEGKQADWQRDQEHPFDQDGQHDTQRDQPGP